ncbi:MAG: hypothetical protein WCK05_06705, partial [Planctomycetota bacterium]
MSRKQNGTRASKVSQQIQRRRSRLQAQGLVPSTPMERCEDRLLLSVVLTNIPDWTAQGPGPTTGGQCIVAGGNLVTGAVEVLVAHPTNADILYAGAVAGGIWRTNNATAASPTWVPLTDQYPSLAISDLKLSPLDATSNTLFAGTGNYIAGGPNGPAVGIYRTTDGGLAWTQLGATTFNGKRLRSVIPTAIGTSLADQVVLVAADDGGGVFRST